MNKEKFLAEALDISMRSSFSGGPIFFFYYYGHIDLLRITFSPDRERYHEDLAVMDIGLSRSAPIDFELFLESLKEKLKTIQEGQQ